MLSKNIINYLPGYLQDISEYKHICNVENEELENIDKNLKSILDETIVAQASEYGISRYENIFNITNKSYNLYERRFVIESIFLNRIPFTIKWLQNKLYKIVGNNYTIDMDYENYKLVIRISYLFESALSLLEADLRKSIPANIDFEIYLNENENVNIYTGGATITGCYEKVEEV